MARQGSQEWKDNISLSKRLKNAERRREKLQTVDEYAEASGMSPDEIVEEQRRRALDASGRGIQIDTETLRDESIVITRAFSPARSHGDMAHSAQGNGRHDQ